MPNTDKLKQFVQTNHQKFDLWQLDNLGKDSDKVWLSIQERLHEANAQNTTNKNQNEATLNHSAPNKFRFSKVFFQVAASLLLLAVASFIFVNINNEGTEGDGSMAQAYPELMEAESYYKGQVEARIQQVKAIQGTTPLPEDVILSDVKSLEVAYNDLKNDLQDNANNEQVISAMIQNYRTRLLILEKVLLELQKIEDSNNSSNNPHTNKNETQI